jgi:hypothetical protein
MSCPFAIPPNEMTRHQAAEHFTWFVSNVLNRVAALRRAMDLNGGDGAALDYTRPSLRVLGARMEPWIELRRETSDEFAKSTAGLPEWLTKWARPGPVMTAQTASLAYDLGIYFGETIRREHPGMRWQLFTRSRRETDYQRPAIMSVIMPLRSRGMINPIYVVRFSVENVRLRGVRLGEDLLRLLRERDAPPERLEEIWAWCEGRSRRRRESR